MYGTRADGRGRPSRIDTRPPRTTQNSYGYMHGF